MFTSLLVPALGLAKLPLATVTPSWSVPTTPLNTAVAAFTVAVVVPSYTLPAAVMLLTVKGLGAISPEICRLLLPST